MLLKLWFLRDHNFSQSAWMVWMCVHVYVKFFLSLFSVPSRKKATSTLSQQWKTSRNNDSDESKELQQCSVAWFSLNAYCTVPTSAAMRSLVLRRNNIWKCSPVNLLNCVRESIVNVSRNHNARWCEGIPGGSYCTVVLVVSDESPCLLYRISECCRSEKEEERRSGVGETLHRISKSFIY